MTNQIKGGGELKVAILAILPKPIISSLQSRDGHGGYSAATHEKLVNAGLTDWQHQWTDRGNALREAVGIISPTPAKAGEDGEAAALRIAWWNDMRDRGVSQDIAIAKIKAALHSKEPRG